MTYINIINAVLRRLRETTVGSNWSGALVGSTGPSDYQVLIGDFVNEVKREVEDAWDWTALRRTEAVSTVSGTKTYTLPSTTQRSRLTSVLEQSQGYFLKRVNDDWIKQTQYPSASETSNKPYYYSLNGTSSGALTAQLYPKPDGVYTVDFNMVDPQDDLSLYSDVLIVPEFPVILGAWARAIAERGEDGGSLTDMAQLQYQQALADSIAQDAGRHSEELVWYA